MNTVSPGYADIRLAAMNYLALREHSVKELKQKLARKYNDWPELVDAVVSELAEQNLQSDERFTAAFIAMRQRQGKGSRLIQLELIDRGIAPALIACFMSESDRIWCDLAGAARTKRFGGDAPVNQRERARQIRFLQSRGFSTCHIQRAFKNGGDE